MNENQKALTAMRKLLIDFEFNIDSFFVCVYIMLEIYIRKGLNLSIDTEKPAKIPVDRLIEWSDYVMYYLPKDRQKEICFEFDRPKRREDQGSTKTKNFNPLDSEFVKYKKTEAAISFFERDNVGKEVTLCDGRHKLRIKILSRENPTDGVKINGKKRSLV